MKDNDKDDCSVSASDSKEHDNDKNAEAGSAEAGIVRGVSRSVAQRAVAARTAGRTIVKLPSVGRLPRAAPRHVATTATKSARLVPVKRVARLTDRVSTGMDLWDSAASSSSGEETANQTTKQTRSKKFYERYAHPIARATTFATVLIKNTVLGAIVFESYCWMVAHTDDLLLKIPTTSVSLPEDDKEIDKLVQTNSHPGIVDDETGSLVPSIYRDVFATTPVLSHYMAGAVAGSLQGIGGSVWDAAALRLAAYRGSNNAVPPTPTPVFQQTLMRSTVQHAIAHSILFGSYESCKRLLLQVIFSDSDEGDLDQDSYDYDDNVWSHQQQQPIKSLLPHQRFEFFAGVSAAGGLAGQFQHVASHILEQQQQQRHKIGNFFVRWPALPSLRSTLWAFPPSAVAFLAFEYGKDTVVKLAVGEDDD